jgi:hypothetical protein
MNILKLQANTQVAGMYQTTTSCKRDLIIVDSRPGMFMPSGLDS